jgi:hypothetical protein
MTDRKELVMMKWHSNELGDCSQYLDNKNMTY